MAIGFPVKANYASGDILTAEQMNDLSGTLNYMDPTAKGDLFPASSGTALTRLAVGNNGETLVADSSTSTGLRYTQAGVNNPIINSGVEIWQRGTADVTLTAASFTYWADRFFGARSAGTSGAKVKYIAASTLAGLPNAFRIQRDSGNTSTNDLYACYDLETKDSVRYAGQTVTLSFYARAGANYSPTSSQVNVKLASGTGTDQGGYATTWTGSTSFISTNQAITTSWVRYSFTGSVASSANQLGLILTITPTGTAGADDYADFTGFQIDLGSVAQPYRRAMGTIQGELAACQRYYYRNTMDAKDFALSNGVTTTICQFPIVLKQTMRVNPTSLESSGIAIYRILAGLGVTGGTLTLHQSMQDQVILRYTTGVASFVAGETQSVYGTGSGSYLAFNAEL